MNCDGSMPMFARIDQDCWRIAKTVPTARRYKLLNAPDFPTIVDLVVGAVVKVVVAREACNNPTEYFRVVATLHCSSVSVVDFFHNGNTGYRAQYLMDPSLGEAANAYCTERFAVLVEARIKKKLPPGWTLDWALSSIRDKAAKSWIHQGLWIRHADEECQDLNVESWLNFDRTDKVARKKARYGRQLPSEENRIDLKGAWVSMDLRRLGSLKVERANDIHRYGFS